MTTLAGLMSVGATMSAEASATFQQTGQRRRPSAAPLKHITQSATDTHVDTTVFQSQRAPGIILM